MRILLTYIIPGTIQNSIYTSQVGSISKKITLLFATCGVTFNRMKRNYIQLTAPRIDTKVIILSKNANN